MKHANKRLIVSLAALVISIALAATSTFAWFTMDATPEVSNINLTVTAQSGLEISYLYETSAGNYSQTPYRSYIDFTEDADGEGGLPTTFAEYLQDLVNLKAVTPSDEGTYRIAGYAYEKTGVVVGNATTPGQYVFAYDGANPLYEQELVDVKQTSNTAKYALDVNGNKIVIRAYGAGGSFSYVYAKEGIDPGDAKTVGDYTVLTDNELTQAKDSATFVYDVDDEENPTTYTPVYIRATTNEVDYVLDTSNNKKCIRAYYEDGEGEEAVITLAYVYEKEGISAGTPTSAGEYTFAEPVTYEAEPQAAVNVQATDAEDALIYEEDDVTPVYVHQTTNAGDTSDNCIPVYGNVKEYIASSTTNFLTVDAGSNKVVSSNNAAPGPYSYAALRFRFRSLSNYKIHLTKAAVTSTAYHGDFLDWDGVNGGGTVINTNAANAARIGFAPSTYISATDQYSVGTSFTKIYEPNHNQGYSGSGLDGASGYYEYVTGFVNPIPLPGYETAPSILLINTDLEDPSKTVVIESMTLATRGDNAGYFVGEVTIFIWMEGTDEDCFNIVLGDDVAINISFEGK